MSKAKSISTRPYNETVAARVKRDPEFAAELEKNSIQTLTKNKKPMAKTETKTARKPINLSDAEIIDALNFKKVLKDDEWVKVRRTNDKGEELPLVTAENIWSECRALEVGHRSCKCGQSGCGRQG